MNEVKLWLESGGSYECGLALLSQYGKNQVLLNYLTKRKNEAKLSYELSKLLPASMTAVSPCVNKQSATIVKRDKIEYESLPASMKRYFDRAASIYQNARKSHYAMKGANSDAARLSFRQGVIGLITEARSLWAILDKWKDTGAEPEEKVDVVGLNASATALSRLLGKLDTESNSELIEKLKEDAAHHVRVLLDSGRILSSKTLLRLEHHNISI